jgi:hypothetical protein
MIYRLITFEVGKLARYYKTKTSAKLITTLLFLGVFLFVGLGIYQFFVSGFRFINLEAVEDIRYGLTLFIYEVFLLTLAGLTLFSALVSSLFTLFKSEHNNWIISSPSYTLLPKVTLLKSISASFVPTLVVFIPAILAFNKVHNLSDISVLCILLSIVLLIVILNLLTLLFITILGTAYYKVSKLIKQIPFTFKGLVISIVLLTTLFIALVWRVLIQLDLGRVFRGRLPEEPLSVESISEYFNYLPSHPVAMQLLHWQTGATQKALLELAVLFGVTLVLGFLWWKTAKLFYPLWQRFQEGSTADRKTLALKGKSYLFTGDLTTVLFKKEILISSRNLRGVMWFLFLALIWLVQIGANLILDNNLYRHQSDVSQKLIVLQTLQYIIAVYFISAFALRFAFPSFSVEKKTAWILGSAPISFKKIFFGKYLFYTSFFIALGVIMSYINSVILSISITNLAYTLILLVTAIVFIVTAGLSLGALFPNTETDDPEVISTSMPGLFFTAIALLYGALSSYVLHTILSGNGFELFSLFLIGTYTLIVLLLITATRKVRQVVF